MLTLAGFEAAREEIAAACTTALDEWQQDADGIDEALGTGGFCGRIADVISAELSARGAETIRYGHDYDGGHEAVIALLAEGPHEFDVPARVYESGAGYSWRKLPGAKIGPGDIAVMKLGEPMSETEFHARWGDEDYVPDTDHSYGF